MLPSQFFTYVPLRSWLFSSRLDIIDVDISLRQVGETRLEATGQKRYQCLRGGRIGSVQSCPATSLPLTGFRVRCTTLRVTLRGGRTSQGGHRQLWGALRPIWGFFCGATIETEHPTQFVVEQLTKAWRQWQHVQGVYTVWQQLAKASTAKVEQGGGRRARSDHLHAALRCRGTRHRIKPLISKLCSSNT